MPLQIFHNPLNLFAVGRAWHLFLAHPHLFTSMHIFVAFYKNIYSVKKWAVVTVNFVVFIIICDDSNPMSPVVMQNLHKFLIFHYWVLGYLTNKRSWTSATCSNWLLQKILNPWIALFDSILLFVMSFKSLFVTVSLVFLKEVIYPFLSSSISFSLFTSSSCISSSTILSIAGP